MSFQKSIPAPKQDEAAISLDYYRREKPKAQKADDLTALEQMFGYYG